MLEFPKTPEEQDEALSRLEPELDKLDALRDRIEDFLTEEETHRLSLFCDQFTRGI